MSMKLIEVIARAIFKGDNQDCNPDGILTDSEGEKTGEPSWTLYTHEAEAVVATLTTPTPEMMAAGLEWIGNEDKPQEWRAAAVANVWAAMLKAAS